MSRLFRYIMGDWWKPVTDGQLWGVYHPTKYHCWAYEMTHEQAKAYCDRKNNG